DVQPSGDGDEQWKQDMRLRLQRTAATLVEGARLMDDIPALRSVAASLQAKTERLRNSRFTLALFGAFSAGKSSFANALIGEGILPVSPNPTTAAINQIVPPTDEWEHGTARV